MKLLSLVTLAAVAATASAECASMKFTFNLKPKFPPNTADDYMCGDLDLVDIESILKDVPNQMGALGYKDISIGNVKSAKACPSYPCTVQPGDKCLPYCFDISFCPGEDLVAQGISVIDLDHIKKIQEIEIDELRGKFPKCLGIKGQFMADLHFSVVS